MNLKILIAAPLAAFLVSVSATERLTVPADWSAVSMGNSRTSQFEWGIEPQLLHEGQRVLTIRTRNAPPPTALAATYTDGYNFQGQRLRVTGWLRGEGVNGWGGVFVATARDQSPWAAGEKDPLPPGAGVGRGDGQWHRFEIVTQVPADSPMVRVGVMLNGGGWMSVSGLQFEPVPDTLAETPERAAINVAAIAGDRQQRRAQEKGDGAPKPPLNLKLAR